MYRLVTVPTYYLHSFFQDRHFYVNHNHDYSSHTTLFKPLDSSHKNQSSLQLCAASTHLTLHRNTTLEMYTDNTAILGMSPNPVEASLATTKGASTGLKMLKSAGHWMFRVLLNSRA